MERLNGMKRRKTVCEFETSTGDTVLKSEVTMEGLEIVKIKTEAYINSVIVAQYSNEQGRSSNIIFFVNTSSVSEHNIYAQLLTEEAERVASITIGELVPQVSQSSESN